MFHSLKLILLLALFSGTAFIYTTEQQKVSQKFSQCGKAVSRLLQSSNSPTNLLLVTGYLRFFTGIYFVNELKKLIVDYVSVTNYSPYIKVNLAHEHTRKSIHFPQKKYLTYTILKSHIYASIFNKNIWIGNYSIESRQNCIREANFFLKNEKDNLHSLFPLEENAPSFSFLVLSKAGYVTYVLSIDGRVRPDYEIQIVDFSSFRVKKVHENITFCQGQEPATFFILLNSPTPHLCFYKVTRQPNRNIELTFTQFDTSNWYKNSQNTFHNLHFLGDKHFVILNHHPDLGSRLFLYNLTLKNPIGSIPFKKKYSFLRRFSYESLCVFSSHKSSMMIFDHITKRFVDIKGMKKLFPLIILPNTRQLIMGSKSSKKVNQLEKCSQTRLFLCSLWERHLIMQDEFQLSKEENHKELINIFFKKNTHGSATLTIKMRVPKKVHAELGITEKVFTLVKGSNNKVIFQ